MQTALVAFDSKQLGLILTKMLSNFAFETVFAENVEQVREYLTTQKTDVFITDWTFAGVDMTAFFSSLADKPITIFVSNVCQPEQIQKALDVGISEYIIKPFDNDILQSKLAMVGLL